MEVNNNLANERTVNQVLKMDESQPVTKKRSYNATLKLKVVEYAEDNSNRAAARKHNMHGWDNCA